MVSITARFQERLVPEDSIRSQGRPRAVAAWLSRVVLGGRLDDGLDLHGEPKRQCGTDGGR